ncbi:hypothetical protein [Myxococcus landrumensis]|uniref:Uncharacterized protein n=1 Tax=Myxococcus landrumensis TaxID=2813577 RepID=A0ABX7N5G4_9BACT|nr:hypothetical protein [Myxococcus landrumus]QSQ14022.1 hypothetical protein JY572_37870 [Myxococcus landrumus]
MTTCDDKPQHEQDYETLSKLLNKAENSEEEVIGVTGYAANLAWPALIHLRDEAAKVPGLVADNATLSDALRSACDSLVSAGHHELANKWREAFSRSGHGAALLERLAKAESERDAVRQERDEAREAFQGMTESRDAAVLSETKAWAKLREEKATLRERVATLERDALHEAAIHEDCMREEHAKAEAAYARGLAVHADAANAAEARVKELEALLSRAATALPASPLSSELIAALSTQPPPAPAQGPQTAAPSLVEMQKRAESFAKYHAEHAAYRGASQEFHERATSFLRTVVPDVAALSTRDITPTPPALVVKCKHCQGKGFDADTDEEGGAQSERRWACSRCKGSGQEPAATSPALVEALAPLVPIMEEALRRYPAGMLALYSHASETRAILAAYHAARAAIPPAVAPALVEAVGKVLEAHRRVLDATVEEEDASVMARHMAMRELRAAYDAAKGGEAVPNTLALEALAHSHGWRGADDVHGLTTWLSGRLEDAAKYRAAMQVLRDLDAHLDFDEPWDAGDLIENPSGINAVFERVRLVLGGAIPTPATLDKARVVEVLESHLGPQLVRAILRDLGLTLDTPTSGQEVDPLVCRDCGRTKGAGHDPKCEFGGGRS